MRQRTFRAPRSPLQVVVVRARWWSTGSRGTDLRRWHCKHSQILAVVNQTQRVAVEWSRRRWNARWGVSGMRGGSGQHWHRFAYPKRREWSAVDGGERQRRMWLRMMMMWIHIRPFVTLPSAKKAAVVEHVLGHRVQCPEITLARVARLTGYFYETVI